MKNKFINEIEIDWDYRDLDPEGKGAVKKIDYNTHPKPWIFTEDKKIIQAFAHIHNGEPVVIPELDPTILYLTSAKNLLIEIIDLKEQLLELAGVKNYVQTAEVFIKFFPRQSIFITSLFTALEAFNNGQIPDEYTFRIKRKVYDKEKIQRYIKFNDKIELIIPDIFKRSFVTDKKMEYESISQIKKMRDEIIHTKNRGKGYAPSYSEIYKDSLSVDFEKVYRATVDYINYYKPNWIEE